MGVLAQRFPDDIARESIGGHGYFGVEIASVPSGRESAQLNSEDGRGRWNVSQGIKEEAQQRVLEAFFYMARARFHWWRFKDWTDFELERANSRLIPISSTTFQLAKVYGDEAAFEYVRRLHRLVNGTLRVWKDNVLTAVTVNIDTGVITFAAAPGAAVLEASCEFDVLCRFDVDGREARLVHRNPDGSRLIAWENISVVEVIEE